MKKKLLTGVLALSMCFVMTGCDVVGTVKDTVGNVTDKVGGFFDGIVDKITGKEDEEEQKSEYNVEAAKEYLKSQYVDKNTQTRANYEVLKEFTYLGKTYTVDWSVDKPEAVKLKVRDNCVKVKVTKTLTQDTTYILTATVKAPDGTSAQVGFRRKVLAMSAVVPEVLEGAPVAETPYKFYVFNQQLQQDQYFAGEMNGYYYKTTTDHNKATDIFVEYLEGSTTEFYVYHEVDGGREYFTVEYGLGDDGNYHTNIYLRETASTVFTYNETINAIVTTVNDSATDATKLTDYFLGNRSNFNTISANNIQYAGTNNVGKLAGMTDRTTIDAADKVARTYRELSLAPAYIGDYEMELPENGDLYAEVNVKWEVVEGDAVTVDEELLTFSNPSEMKEVTLKATISLGEGEGKVEQTKTFPFKVFPKTEAGIVDAATALVDGEALGNRATLTGKVTSIVEVYNPEYENVTIMMDVNGTAFEAYRMKGTGANEIAVGYTVTVSGTLKNFKGTLEFDTGCTLDAFVYGEPPHEHVYVDGKCECGADEPTDVLLDVVYPVADKAYYLSSPYADGELYFNGELKSGRIQATANSEESVLVYFEATDVANEFYLYYMDGETKMYILGNVKDSSTDKYTSTSFDVKTTKDDSWIIDGEKQTIVSKASGRMIATKSDATHLNFSTYAVSNYGKDTYVASWLYTTDSTAVGQLPSGGDTPVTPPSTDTSTIAQVIAGTNGNTYKISGTVVAIYNRGFLIKDATGMLLVYAGYEYANDVVVGQKLTVNGKLGENGGLKQFTYDGLTYTGTETEAVTHATPVVLDAAAAEAYLTAPAIKYVTVTGTLAKSGDYYNLNIEGTTTAVGSLAYPNAAQANLLNPLDGKKITVTGYAISVSSSKYVNIMVDTVVEVSSGDHTHNFVDGECECGETDPNYNPGGDHTHNFVDGECECGETDPNYNPGGEVVVQSPATLTVTALNVLAYSTDTKTATVGGIEFSYVQIGAYDSTGAASATNNFGLQFRTKNGVSGSLWNSTALPGNLTKIVLVPNATKSGSYSNAYTLALGTTSACSDKTMNVSTNGGNTVTITIEGSYTYFKLTHANTYTQYFDSIEVHYATGTTHSHSYTEVYTDPTCTEDGYTTFTCACEHSYVEVDEGTAGHTYDNGVVTNPTCTEVGYTTYTCTRTDCGHSYTADEKPSKGHNYSSEVTLEPTLNSTGIRTFTCQNDPTHTYTEVIPMLEGAAAKIGDVKYATFAEALAAAVAGDTIVLAADVNATEIITLDKAITLDGAGYYTINSTAGRAINVDCDGAVTIQNLTIVAGEGCERGINIINQAATVTVDNVKISGTSYYAVHVAFSATGVTLTVKNSTLENTWGAVAVYGDDHVVSVVESNLKATNRIPVANDEDFAVIALGGDNITLTVDVDSSLTAVSSAEHSVQAILCAIEGQLTNSSVTIDAELHLEGDNTRYLTMPDWAVNTVKLPATFVEEVKAEDDFCAVVDGNYVVITAHDYTSNVTAPTCVAAGYTTFTCACGDTYTEAGEAATGVHTGHETDYKCDVCSKVVEPAADSVLTIPQANALAKALGSNVDSTNKYYMTFTIIDIYDTKYGNMNVKDADGNKFILYGYFADGKRFDSVPDAEKPLPGDEITMHGKITNYNGSKPEMKNGDLDELVRHEHAYTDVVTDPTCFDDGYTTKTCSICKHVEKVVDEGSALGHTTDNGTCERCGNDIGGDGPVIVEKTYSYTFTKTTFDANNQTKALGDINWTLDGSHKLNNGKGYWGYDATKGQQFGSSKAYYTSMTLTSEESFSNVSKIVIKTSGASSINATFKVYVGGQEVDSVKITATATEYVIEVNNLSGEIKFEYTNSSAKAIYINSITVDYAVEQ